jgi:hypothetical protein
MNNTLLFFIRLYRIVDYGLVNTSLEKDKSKESRFFAPTVPASSFRKKAQGQRSVGSDDTLYRRLKLRNLKAAATYQNL